MANAVADLIIDDVGDVGRRVFVPQSNVAIFKGTMVCQLTASGNAVKGGTALTGRCIGVASFGFDASALSAAARDIELETDRVFVFASGTAGDAITAAGVLVGADVYIIDDNTVGKTDGGATRQKAGKFVGMHPDGRVRVYISANL